MIGDNSGSSATVRVFVPTYRRHNLLPRALNSLLAQTYTSWVCEVHNDDPADAFPAELVQRLGDPRIEVHTHKKNLGANQTFNLFFHPTKEPFYSLLEDDNWWEPDFLGVMLSEIEAHPEVTVAWCNQRIWEELPDGSWRDTRQLVNPPEPEIKSRLVPFGNPKQMGEPIHSNGAMLLRSRLDKHYATPLDLPFAMMESFRDRLLPFPLLYVPEALAIFSLTQTTARAESLVEYVLAQNILVATFVANAQYDEAQLIQVVNYARTKRSPGTTSLLWSALVDSRCRAVLRHLRLEDYLLFLRSLIRRPQMLFRMLRSREQHAEWWKILDEQTALRFQEDGRSKKQM